MLSNAIFAIDKAQRERGLIFIHTDVVVVKNISKIQITVEDNGIGIPNKNRDKIYEQGFTTREHRGGTGMGLYISKLIVEEYGGIIYLDSKLGQGTKFYVEIPINGEFDFSCEDRDEFFEQLIKKYKDKTKQIFVAEVREQKRIINEPTSLWFERR